MSENPEQDKETLLPIHRELTDKEKIDWLRKQLNEVEERNVKLSAANQSLTDRNRNLLNRIKEWEEEVPGDLKKADTVSAKAYIKLKKRCDMFETRTWELVAECKELQSQLSTINKTD